jgi:hypothetical protein
MDALLQEMLWNQFGAAIDMLENAIAAFPEELWVRNREPAPWYIAYHTLVYGTRHTQHHVGQLNLLLRQETDAAPRWVGRARA